MAYYLQMDGVDDRIQVPSMTFTKIVMDFKANNLPASGQARYWSLPLGSNFVHRINGVDAYSGGVTSVTVNGISVTNNTVFVTVGQRIVMESISTNTNSIWIFSNNGSTAFVNGDIWNIKIYNGATLVAHYDMTLGNVQDQSGNGRHATLTGGTWVSESTGTTQEGAASITGVSTLSASATVIPAAITGSASLQGVATLSATANVVTPSLTGSASLTGVGSVTATANVIRAGSAVLQGVSTLTANAAGLSVLGGAFLTGVGWLMASAIEGTELVSVIYLMGKRDLDIQLMGKRDLDVQLSASQELTVHLYGSR